MSRPIVVIICMGSSSDSWEPYQRPHPWHSRAGGGAVHSITSGPFSNVAFDAKPTFGDWTQMPSGHPHRKKIPLNSRMGHDAIVTESHADLNRCTAISKKPA